MLINPKGITQVTDEILGEELKDLDLDLETAQCQTCAHQFKMNKARKCPKCGSKNINTTAMLNG